MKDFKEIDKILEAADLICINCVEDTLNKNICDNCPVRKLCLKYSHIVDTKKEEK